MSKSVWRLYLGGNDSAGGHCYPEREIWGAAQQFVSNCTIYPTTGMWHRKVEQAWVIEMVGSKNLMLDLVDHLKKVFRQSTIMVVDLGKAEIL